MNRPVWLLLLLLLVDNKWFVCSVNSIGIQTSNKDWRGTLIGEEITQSKYLFVVCPTVQPFLHICVHVWQTDCILSIIHMEQIEWHHQALLTYCKQQSKHKWILPFSSICLFVVTHRSGDVERCNGVCLVAASSLFQMRPSCEPQ